tara:strand:- start:466 stop:1386 length:921 start_codon:yes stop_codon:yes gene_type:complete
MSVIKAERVVDFIGDETLYHFKVEIIEIEKVMVSVFNTQTGVTYKTYINKCDDWFKSNIYIFTGDFRKVFSILNESLIENKETLPHKEYEEHDMIKIIINYEHELYPFELELPIKKYVSENGVLDDRINSLEYQVHVLKNMLSSKTSIHSSDGKIYNEVGNLIYEGEMKDGKRHGEGIEYCPTTGDKLRKGTFKDGYYNGTVIRYNHDWFDKCCIEEESEYKQGKKHGFHKHYAARKCGDAYLYTTANYYRGIMHGESINYDEIGNINITVMYNMGVQDMNYKPNSSDSRDNGRRSGGDRYDDIRG